MGHALYPFPQIADAVPVTPSSRSLAAQFRHGTVRLKPSLASLPGILRDAMHRVHRLHAHACIVPVVEDSAAELDTCVVDPGRLRQIAVHALSRAARASEDRVVILRLCADGVPSPLPPVLPPGRWSRARGGVRDSRIAHAASTASQTSGPPSRQHSTPLAAGAAPSPAPAQPVYSSPRYESAPCDSGSSDTQSDSQRSSGSFAFLRKLWPSSAEKAAHEAHRPGSRHGQDAEAGEVATRLDGTSPTARRAEADEASPPSSFAAESEESDAARDLPPWIRYFTSNNGTVVRTGWLPEDEASLAARQYPDADWMHLHVQYVTLQVIDAGPSLRPEDEVVHGVEDRCAAPSSSSGGGGGGGGRVGPGQPAGAGGDGDESDEEEAAAPAKGGAGDPASPPVTPSPAAPPAEGRAPLMDIGEDAHVSTAFAGVGMPLVQRLVAEMRGSLALVNRASRPLSETDAKRVQSCLLRQLCEPPTDRVPRLARRFDTVSSIGTLGSGAASQSGGAQRGAAEAATPSRDALRRALATARAEQGTLFHVRIPILTYRPSPSPIRLPVAPVVGSGSAVSTRSVPGAPASVQGPASARRGPVSLAVAPAAKEEDGTGGRWKFPLPDPTAEGGEAAPVRGSDPGGGPWAMAGAAAVGGDEVAEPGVVMSLQRRPGAGQQYSWGRQLGRQLTPSPPASGGDQRRKRWRHSDEVSVRDEWASRVLSGTAVGLADRAHGSVTDSPGSVGRRGSIGSTAGSSCRRGSTDTRRVESAAVLPGTSPLFLRQGSARTQSATGLAEGAATAAPEALRVSVRGDHALGGGAAGQRSQQRSADAASPPVMDDHAAGRMRTRATSSTSVSPSAQAESVRGGSLAGGEAPSTTTDAAPSNDSTAPAAGSREPSHRTGRRLWKTARALVDEEREEGASHASRQRSAAEGSGQFMSPDTSFSLTGPGQAPVPATGGDAAADAFASGSSDHRLLRRTGGPGGGVAGPQARGHALALRSLMLDPQARAAPSSQAGSDGASGGGSSGDGRSSESVHSSIRTPSVSQRVASMSQGPFLSSAASWRVHSGGGSTVVGRRSVRPPTLPPIPSDAAEAGVADGAQEDGGAPAAVGTTSGAAVSATMPPLPAPPAPAAPPSGDGAAGAVALPAVQGKGAPSSTALPQLPSVPGLPQAQATPMDTAPVSRGVTRAPERGGAGATSTAEEAAGSSGGRRLRDLNVLIVDDEQTNRRLMRHMLRRIGVGAVEEADDGKTVRISSRPCPGLSPLTRRGRAGPGSRLCGGAGGEAVRRPHAGHCHVRDARRRGAKRGLPCSRVTPHALTCCPPRRALAPLRCCGGCASRARTCRRWRALATRCRKTWRTTSKWAF